MFFCPLKNKMHPTAEKILFLVVYILVKYFTKNDHHYPPSAIKNSTKYFLQSNLTDIKYNSNTKQNINYSSKTEHL